MRKKARLKIKVNNRLKEYGNEEGGKIEINVAKHHGNKAELADTVFHEGYHAKHPKASEKKTYAVTRKAMKEMTFAEKEKLAAKVRSKKIHYKQGALKRRYKMKPGKVEPGAYISRMNESKVHKKTNRARTSGFKSGVQALI